MSRDKKKAAASGEGCDGDARPHASSLLQSEPNLDMRAMIRMLMEEQMRAENERAEARRVADLEKEAAAREAAQRQYEQQEALATKQYEQQVALMRMQADIGERAA